MPQQAGVDEARKVHAASLWMILQACCIAVKLCISAQRLLWFGGYILCCDDYDYSCKTLSVWSVNTAQMIVAQSSSPFLCKTIFMEFSSKNTSALLTKCFWLIPTTISIHHVRTHLISIWIRHGLCLCIWLYIPCHKMLNILWFVY